MINQPDPHNGSKASIREVYAIVKDLEEKVVDELHRTEGRLIEAIEKIDGAHQRDIADLRVDVDDLKDWRDRFDDRYAAKVARKEGMLWPVLVGRDIVRQYWQVLVVLFAILMFLINDLHVDIR